MPTALSELQRRFFDRMDEGQSQYVTPQQATDTINEAYSQLWGIYVDRAPVHIEKDYTFMSVAGQRDYALPADFRRAVKMYMVCNGRYVALRTYERERYNRNGWYGIGSYMEYEILGGNIRISQTPTGNSTQYELWYIPHFTALVNPLDVLDSRIFPGHEQWIVNQAVIMIKVGKEEQPADDLIAMNDRLRQQIENDLIMRDMGEHNRVVMYDRYDQGYDPYFLSACGGGLQAAPITTPTGAGSSNTTGGSTGSTGSTSTGSTGGSTGSTSTPTSGSTLFYIYKNGTQNQWQNDYNYGGSFTIAGDTRTTGGVSISGTVNQYGAFNFGSPNATNINAQNYLGIQFDAYAASGAPTIRVQIDPGGSQSPVVSEMVTLSTGWNTYTFLYSDASATNNSSVTSTFTNVEFINLNAATTPTIYLNNIALIVNPNPPAPTYQLVPTDTNPAATISGWLHVKGNQFYDASNTVWMGRGVNCPDTRLDGKSYTVTPQTMVVAELTRRIQFAIDQGVDFFRLLLDMRNSSDDIVNNSDYLTAIKQVVDYIGLQGCHVLISCWNDWTASPFGNGQSGQPTIATLTHLGQLATSFRNSGHVLFGLCNEPRGNSTPAQLTAYMNIVNQAISVIRQVEARDAAPNPHIIIVQGSSSYSRNIPYFLTNPATDSYYPITSSTSVGYIGYEVHCYEAASYWPSEFETAANTIPLIVGEFAPNDPNGTMLLNTTTDDVTPLMSYCSAHNIPYLAWTFDYNSPPDMLVNNATDGSYGVNQTLQWTQPWGLTFINNLRAQKGLSGTVDVYGHIAGTGGSTGSTGTGGTGGSSGGSYTVTSIFANGIQSSGGWNDGSYTGTYSTASDTRVTGGVAKTAVINQYGAVNFSHAALSVTAYKGIRFDAYAATGAPSIRVQIDLNDVTTPIIYEMKTLTGTWATYTFLWTDSSAVGTASGTFSNVELVNLNASTTPMLYINNVTLLS